MAYLLQWANSDDRLTRHVTSLEKDFADGHRFLELLQHEGLLKPQEATKLKRGDQLDIYEGISSALEAAGCAYNPSNLGKVMRGARGAAPALLLAIKKTTDALRSGATGPTHTKPPRGTSPSTVTKSARPKKFERQELNDWGKDDFFQKTYDAYDVFEWNKIDMAVHLRKFHDKQRSIERDVTSKEEGERRDFVDRRTERRDYELVRRHEKTDFLARRMAECEQAWRDSMQGQKLREKRELAFELTMSKRASIENDISRWRHTTAMEAGVDYFEKNMKRLGVGLDSGNDVGPGGKLMSTASESAINYLERIEREAQACVMSDESKAEMILDLKSKAKANRVARLERERRRRKMMVDQLNAHDQLEGQRKEEEFLENLLEEGKRQRLAAQGRWEKEYKVRKAREQRERRTKQLQSTHARLKDEAIDELAGTARATFEENAEQRREIWKNINNHKRDKAQASRVKHVALCRDVVDGLISLVFAVADAKKVLRADPASGRHSLYLSEWQTLKRGFIRDTLRPPPPQPVSGLEVTTKSALGMECRAMDTLTAPYASGGDGPSLLYPSRLRAFEGVLSRLVTCLEPAAASSHNTGVLTSLVAGAGEDERLDLHVDDGEPRMMMKAASTRPRSPFRHPTQGGKFAEECGRDSRWAFQPRVCVVRKHSASGSASVSLARMNQIGARVAGNLGLAFTSPQQALHRAVEAATALMEDRGSLGSHASVGGVVVGGAGAGAAPDGEDGAAGAHTSDLVVVGRALLKIHALNEPALVQNDALVCRAVIAHLEEQGARLTSRALRQAGGGEAEDASNPKGSRERDSKGWVCVDFPHTPRQAALLDYFLSGKEVPDKDLDSMLEESVAIEDPNDDDAAGGGGKKKKSGKDAKGGKGGKGGKDAKSKKGGGGGAVGLPGMLDCASLAHIDAFIWVNDEPNVTIVNHSAEDAVVQVEEEDDEGNGRKQQQRQRHQLQPHDLRDLAEEKEQQKTGSDESGGREGEEENSSKEPPKPIGSFVAAAMVQSSAVCVSRGGMDGDDREGGNGGDPAGEDACTQLGDHYADFHNGSLVSEISFSQGVDPALHAADVQTAVSVHRCVETLELLVEAAHERWCEYVSDELMKEMRVRKLEEFTALAEAKQKELDAAREAAEAAGERLEESAREEAGPIEASVLLEEAFPLSQAFPVDITRDLEARRGARRDNLDVSGRIWQRVVCGETKLDPSVAMRVLDSWRAVSAKNHTIKQQTCLALLQVDDEIGRFLDESCWSVVQVLRSGADDGDDAQHHLRNVHDALQVAIKCRPSILGPGMREDQLIRTDMVHTLEGDLGDIVDARHSNAMSMIDQIVSEAKKWSIELSKRAANALATVAIADMNLLGAAESMLGEYFGSNIGGISPVEGQEMEGEGSTASLCGYHEALLGRLRDALARSALTSAPEGCDDENDIGKRDSIEYDTSIHDIFDKALAQVSLGLTSVSLDRGGDDERVVQRAMLTLRTHLAEKYLGFTGRLADVRARCTREAKAVRGKVVGLVKSRADAEYASVSALCRELEARAGESGQALLEALNVESPIRTVGNNDGLFVTNPQVVMDLGNMGLSIRQLTQIVSNLVTAAGEVPPPAPETGSGNSGSGSGDASVAEALLRPDTVRWAFEEVAVEANERFPEVWKRTEVFAAMASCISPTVGTEAEPMLHWKLFVFHIVASWLPRIASVRELLDTAVRLRAKRMDHSKVRLAVSREDFMDMPLWFDQGEDALDTFTSQAIKGLLAMTFYVSDQYTGLGAAVCGEELLFAFALSPAEVAGTGYCEGLHRLAAVANMLFPRVPAVLSAAEGDGDMAPVRGLRLSAKAVRFVVSLVPSGLVEVAEQGQRQAEVGAGAPGVVVPFEELPQQAGLEPACARGAFQLKKLIPVVSQVGEGEREREGVVRDARVCASAGGGGEEGGAGAGVRELDAGRA